MPEWNEKMCEKPNIKIIPKKHIYIIYPKKEKQKQKPSGKARFKSWKIYISIKNKNLLYIHLILQNQL